MQPPQLSNHFTKPVIVPISSQRQDCPDPCPPFSPISCNLPQFSHSHPSSCCHLLCAIHVMCPWFSSGFLFPLIVIPLSDFIFYPLISIPQVQTILTVSFSILLIHPYFFFIPHSISFGSRCYIPAQYIIGIYNQLGDFYWIGFSMQYFSTLKQTGIPLRLKHNSTLILS